jgi:hypothetical protein
MWNVVTLPVFLFVRARSSLSGSARSVGEAFVFSEASSSYSKLSRLKKVISLPVVVVAGRLPQILDY